MLEEVEFHTGVADRLRFACRLLRKAYRQGARIVVMAPADQLAALDRELWTFDERDFVPHLRVGASARPAAARTPIWLVEGQAPADAPDILVNLGAGAPAQPERFRRIIEIVGAEDAEAGRQRWRQYKAQGLRIRHHAPEAGG